MKLLNTKTEEQYTFVPTGDTIISWKRCEWLEIPIHQTTPNDMLSGKPKLTTLQLVTGVHVICI